MVGSLYWDDHATRRSLREKFLSMPSAKSVPAPIRYGRKSDLRDTVTMVFSSSCTANNRMGQAKLAPFRNEITSAKELDEITAAIIKAEHKKEPGFERFNWEWGCLAVLVNPKAGRIISKQIKEYWSKKFGKKFDSKEYKIGKEKAIVSSLGMLQFDWQTGYGNVDFVVVTATKPNIDPIPASNQLADHFALDSTYFENNCRSGISTYQDQDVGAILRPCSEPKPAHKVEWLPDGWTSKSLGQLFNFKNGINAGKESYGKGVKFVNVMEVIYNDHITSENVPGSVHVSKDQMELYVVKKGDVLFNRTSETTDEIGLSSVYLGDDPVVFGGFVIRGRPLNSFITDDFKKYCFRSKFVRDQIIKNGQGAIRTNIGQGDLEKVIVPLPPIPLQEQISQALNEWSDSTRLMADLVSKKETQKSWVMNQLLTGKQRLTGFKAKWKKYHYDDLLDVVKRPIQWNDSELYHLVSVRRRSGGIFERESLFGHQIKVKDLRTANEGDFLFSKMQIVHGASALVNKAFAGSAISGSYIAVVAKDKKILDIRYLDWYSRTPYFYHQTYISSYGVHIEKMTFDFESFLSLDIDLPSIEEQREIVKILQGIEEELRLLKAKLEKLKRQKKGLMQILLTGKQLI
jgi:type I restriction enzyme S subunit